MRLIGNYFEQETDFLAKLILPNSMIRLETNLLRSRMHKRRGKSSSWWSLALKKLRSVYRKIQLMISNYPCKKQLQTSSHFPELDRREAEKRIETSVGICGCDVEKRRFKSRYAPFIWQILIFRKINIQIRSPKKLPKKGALYFFKKCESVCWPPAL